MPDEVNSALDIVMQEDPSYWLGFFDMADWRVRGLVALVAGGILLWFVRVIARSLRRQRRIVLHPKVQMYGSGADYADDKLISQRRTEAEKIIATSSTATIAGYEITEQVEAVFVDGFRRPESALEGLKAAAAMKGGNAVTNVRQERTSAGKCSANGDAVIVHRILAADVATLDDHAEQGLEPQVHQPDPAGPESAPTETA